MCEVRLLFSDPLGAVEWNDTPGRIGETHDGPAIWLPEHGNAVHLLIAGPTGCGKSSAALSLVATLCADKEAYFAFVDTKKLGLAISRRFACCCGSDRPRRCACASSRCPRRDASTFSTVGSPPRRKSPRITDSRTLGPLYLVVDEVASLLAEDLPGEDPKNAKERVRSSRAILANIARLSRQVSIFLVLSMQRPDVSLSLGSSGEFRDNVTSRLGFSLSSSGREMLFGPEWRSLAMSGQPGRGHFQGQASDPLTPLPVVVPAFNLGACARPSVCATFSYLWLDNYGCESFTAGVASPSKLNGIQPALVEWLAGVGSFQASGDPNLTIEFSAPSLDGTATPERTVGKLSNSSLAARIHSSSQPSRRRPRALHEVAPTFGAVGIVDVFYLDHP